VATVTNVLLVDDLDNSVAEETIEFALEGKTYEIDLSGPNVAKLRDVLAPYVAAARRVGGGRSDRRSRAADGVGARRDVRAARAWLKEHGYPVPRRGRLRPEYIKAYAEKRPATPPADHGSSPEFRAPEAS